MKIITTNLIISIVLIVCDRKYFSYPMKLNSLGENNLHSKNIERNMIPTEDHLMLKNSTLINKIDKLTANLTDHNFLTLKNLTRINYEKNQMNETPDPARILYNKIRNKTEHINSNILFGNNTNTIEIISKNLDSSITNLRKFHKTLEEKIKNFEIPKFDEVTSLSSAHCKSKKKKYSKENNNDDNFMFYNSLSLIMLSMLAGGLVGIIFILYFSFKEDGEK